jgi:hypothetical protein
MRPFEDREGLIYVFDRTSSIATLRRRLNSATFRKMSDKTFTHQSNVPSVEARGVGLSFPVYPHTQRRIRGNLEFVRDCPFGCCLCLLVLAIASLGGRSRVLALLMFALLPLSFRLNSCVGGCALLAAPE